ncbi:porphobilinogen deaminase-like isoform X2 [Varroa jacobsoni]|nr:porphobilinogen deaminase-like isoform X3 [Varroa destructor]XP_022710065.1 porphobilinogen deaminase-like isoform X2 [Varroa jacobsoni]
MVQANSVKEQLKTLFPENEFEIVGMTTKGDKNLNMALPKMGDKSLFTTELEEALIEGTVDLAVHSLKDVPTKLPENLCIGAILEREDPSDAVVFPIGSSLTSLAKLKAGAKIGTSSLRRIAQLRRKYKHLDFVSVRGNLNTRLDKLDNKKQYDALVLAVSGLRRLNMADRISCILPSELCLYAVGQGALAVEIRRNDDVTQSVVQALNNRMTALRCLAERNFMMTLEGGCSVPLGVSSALSESRILSLKGGVFAFAGEESIVEESKVTLTICSQIRQQEMHVGILCPGLCASEVNEAVALGANLAQKLLQKGAKELLEKAREDARQSIL